MTEFSRALIVKLRERKGWDLSPGNYAEMKNRWIHKEVASNNKFEVSSKLFTSSQAFDQHPPSCPQNTRSPSEAATAAAASAAAAATAAVPAAAARLQPSPARLPLSPAPCLSCVCVCVCSATAWGAPARLGSQRRKPRRELQLLPPLVLPLAGAGLPAAAAAAWSAGVGLRGASPLAASVLPGCLQVILAASHVSVPEAETEKKTRFIPSSTAILYFILNLIFIPTFYSLSVSTFSVAFLSYSFFLVPLFFSSSSFFFPLLWLLFIFGKAGGAWFWAFSWIQVFLACDGSVDKALCLGVRGDCARWERLPSPARYATGLKEKAMWSMVPIFFFLCKNKKHVSNSFFGILFFW